MSRILLCGHKSFAAKGLSNIFSSLQLEYDCFTRGEEDKQGRVITGDVFHMKDNKHLNKYDTVVNFIIIKDKSIEENIEYVDSLLDFCKRNGVKHLVQISSISVYPNDAGTVDESSPIEENPMTKGGYGAVKVAVDQYLMQNAGDIHVSFVRPGFIYAPNHEISSAGIFVHTLLGNILLGDKKNTLPLVSRASLHQAIVAIVQSSTYQSVYLCLDCARASKKDFVLRQWSLKRIIPLPRFVFVPIANISHKLGLLPNSVYSKVHGVFKSIQYNNQKTIQATGVDFKAKDYAVIGAGAYGSYTCKTLSEKYPHETITLYEVGNDKVQDEEEIGYKSNITKAPYSGLKKGRFFSFGGATTKWGGQLLTFTDNDFANPSKFLKEIVECNVKYKEKVMTRFGLLNDDPETHLTDRLFTKTGIWLSYFHRNLFKLLGVGQISNVVKVPDTRISRLIKNEVNEIEAIEVIQNGEKKLASHDNYFLTAGAFESARLLMNSDIDNVEEKNCRLFSDHMSQRVFLIKSGTKIGEQDFRFKISGASLITKRMIGEINGVSFYAHPIFNQDFPFFENLKKLMFGRVFSIKIFGSILKDIPACIQFAYNVLVLKRMYVHKNQFYIQVDIENPIGSGKVYLNTKDKDNFGEPSIDVDYTVDDKTDELFAEAKRIVREYLDQHGVEYEELETNTSTEKYEDTYHPFGTYCNFDDLEDFYTRIPNLLVMNTAVLPRAGGINSTCAGFPIIEDYVNRKMN